jgi:hypothetical protein
VTPQVPEKHRTRPPRPTVYQSDALGNPEDWGNALSEACTTKLMAIERREPGSRWPPTGANEKDITANYKDGVLEVRLPVGQTKAAASRVPITRG